MAKNIEKRIEKIEQKVGSDTIEIKSMADLIAFADKVEKRTDVGNVTVEPKLAELIKRAACAHKEDQDEGQKY